MQKKIASNLKKISAQQRLVSVGLLILVLIVAVFAAMQPKRSVETFCATYKEENAKVKATSSSSDYAKYAKVYQKLERVAPDEIRPDVKVVRQIFEKLDKDPSQGFSAGLSGLSAEANIKSWTAKNCQ